jgi:hypothetical protein
MPFQATNQGWVLFYIKGRLFASTFCTVVNRPLQVQSSQVSIYSPHKGKVSCLPY